MSKGIEVFLHNREVGAPSQPNPLAYGKEIRYITLGDEYKSIPILAMFDIYCDGQNIWNGIRPISDDDIGCIYFDGAQIKATRIPLLSSNTLGDQTDEATYHPSCYEYYPKRYLLSTNVEDTRTWRINLSFLTKKSSETLVMSWEFQPKEIMNLTYNKKSIWDDQETELSDSIGSYIGVVLNKKMKRCSSCRKDAECMLLSKENSFVECNADYNHFDICFWLDERDPSNKRFHLTTNFVCENSFLGGMILNVK
ncbi:predicted protein [Chaetoceros tenuissimus]|uniref:Uncharacterized protein n=1 Tax=Chaetoceros tenuissimus TaxID=426638 RepID=A0AAD3H9P1_9STRA|nr:predicted protein [Chaetoceros tenuissimus]